MARQQRPDVAGAELAAVAARALVDGSAADFAAARDRACRELGVGPKVGRGVDNLAIHRALVEHLGLFHGAGQRARIKKLRQTARRALTLLAPFRPRLCGPVWYGTALAGDAVNVHLFSDETEAVTRFLLEHNIDYQLDEAGFVFGGERVPVAMPVFITRLGGAWFELAVFPTRGRHHHPFSGLDQRPLRRVGLAELDRAIADDVLFADVH